MSDELDYFSNIDFKVSDDLDYFSNIDFKVSSEVKIRKALLEKYCSDKDWHWNDLYVIIPEKYKLALTTLWNYDWVFFDPNLDSITFYSNRVIILPTPTGECNLSYYGYQLKEPERIDITCMT